MVASNENQTRTAVESNKGTKSKRSGNVTVNAAFLAEVRRSIGNSGKN